MSNHSDGEPAPLALWLGYAGAAPFLGMGLFALTGPASGLAAAIDALGGYGAVVSSFLGGMIWGRALTGDPARRDRELLAGVGLSLWGWAALATPRHVGLPMLATGLIAAYVYDRAQARRGAVNPWLLRLRFRLTCAAVLGLALGFAGVV